MVAYTCHPKIKILNQGEVNYSPAWDPQQDLVAQNPFCGSMVCSRPLRPFTPRGGSGLSQSFRRESRWLCIQNPTMWEVFQILSHAAKCILLYTVPIAPCKWLQEPSVVFLNRTLTRSLKTPSNGRRWPEWWPHKITTWSLTSGERGSEREG